MYTRIKDLEKRFWSRVNKGLDNECWEGKVKPNGHGYCDTQINNKSYRLHRLSWQIHYGNIPENIDVLHKCDNRKCCNPNHLFLGTDIDNALDKKRKNRGRTKGKLTPAQVKQIRVLYKQGYNCNKLSKIYKISWQRIKDIVNNIYYRWV